MLGVVEMTWIEWNRIAQLEGISKDDRVQLPDYFRANEELKHIIKDNIQIPLDHWQAQDINSLLEYQQLAEILA